jgi:5-methylcytosine-specific restriction enzyme B
MNLHDCLKKVLDEWNDFKNQPFKNNPMGTFFRGDFKKTVEEIVNSVNNNLVVVGRVGAGNMANVPWLSVLDNRITDTTRDGIYPVYLFRSDGSGVYLSLNQGTTIPKDLYGRLVAQERASSISVFLQSKIGKISNWDNSQLDLRATTSLGRSYELPNIAAKYYSSDKLPSNEQLLQDLLDILSIYNDIYVLWPEIRAMGDFQHIEREIPRLQERNQQKSERDFDQSSFKESIEISGLILCSSQISRFIASLQTKPFIILTGLSGSGKTKLAEAFSLWMSESENQFCMVSVGADWTNREPLLGFPNALQTGEYVKPDCGALDLIIRAESDPKRPYFLILDEMNMSHVERYFADFLSAMESVDRTIALHPDTVDWDEGEVPATIKLPKNLFIIGTVNIDETTYMFSPKVLDRANVIEFRVSESEMVSFLKEPRELDMDSLRGAGSSMGVSFVRKSKEKGILDVNLSSDILPFFNGLEELGAEFGYRTASEIIRFVAICTEISGGKMKPNDIIDAAIIQKLLPKIHGSRNKIEKVLNELGKLCLQDEAVEHFQLNDDKLDKYTVKYPLSFNKLKRMHKRVMSDGFASFAEA